MRSRSLIRKLLLPLGRLARLSDPEILGRENIAGLERVHSIHASSTVAANRTGASLRLGEGVYVGRNVEIEADGDMIVGARVSFQDGCVIRGCVRIGADCIFARNVLVISTEHNFRHEPSWLIRDQDNAAALADKTVEIGEDCWFGWGAAVMPGVRIGRGAVIGANCVVTRDIGPYEIHGGVPNRKIGTRLAFRPPAELDISDPAIPYYYSGFAVTQEALRQSRLQGVVWAGPEALIAMAGGTGKLRVEGDCRDGVTLAVTVNGLPRSDVALTAGTFAFETDGADGDICWLALRHAEKGRNAAYGISRITFPTGKDSR